MQSKMIITWIRRTTAFKTYVWTLGTKRCFMERHNKKMV